MMRGLALIAALGSAFVSTLAYAATREEVCVKFEKEYGWSKGYAVQATIISGSDLNSAVGSFNRFKPFSTYAVVFWDENQASIFELPPLSTGQRSDVRNWSKRSGRQVMENQTRSSLLPMNHRTGMSNQRLQPTGHSLRSRPSAEAGR